MPFRRFLLSAGTSGAVCVGAFARTRFATEF
jgi:hypothetical protein